MQTLIELDKLVSEWVVNLLGQSPQIGAVARIGAVWLVYLVPLILIVFWFYGPREKMVGLRVALSGLFGWLVVNNIIGWLFFRARPSAQAARELLFHRPDKAFPSDHATLGFAIATGLYLAGYRKLATFIFSLTILLSFFRIATGLHYAADVVVGFIVGIVVALVFFWLRKWIDQYLVNPLVKVARVLKL